MPTRPIKITGSSASTGSLVLDDHGHTRAKAGDTILWQIGHDSGVESITSIEEKPGSASIWSTRPHMQGSNWRGDISSTAPDYAEYKYSIGWRGSDGAGPHLYDPKISIRPSKLVDTIASVLVTVATVAAVTVLVLFTRDYFRRRKTRK